MYDLSGKVAVITGAGGRHGIGRAIATRLAQEGADVVVTDIERSLEAIRPEDRQAGWQGLPSVVSEIEAMGRQALAVYSDVSDGSQVDDMVNRTLERFGRIDILVNNAGSRPGRDRVPVVELEEDAFDEVIRVNVRGTYLCSRAVARHMISRGGGKIIVISSGAGKRGIARYAAYCASKFALIGFTQSLAQELAAHHINVNAICPGLVDTERVDYIAAALALEGHSAQEHRALMIRERNTRVPLGRVAVGDDIAKTAAFLASSESDYLTGLSISVSGGAEMS
jgi:NAD(P)-dependent dehydrogenase (short-subunit alcohol dehydrogenase family)